VHNKYYREMDGKRPKPEKIGHLAHSNLAKVNRKCIHDEKVRAT
jgi:hypothetical protein